MKTTQQGKELFGCETEIQPEENGCTVYRLPAVAGQVVMQAYTVFPGITLVYDNIHAQSCTIRRNADSAAFAIRHCREGRMESSMEDEFYYIGPGDLSIGGLKNGTQSSCFPLCHYHGITVIIDVEKAPQCLSCVLDDVNVQPRLLMKKFCSGPTAFVARSLPSIEHIFSELYSVPENIKKGYLKVKVLELLLFLSGIDTDTDELSRHCYSYSQRLLAKEVCQYLTEHMESRITLEQLADRFHVSGTQIKNSVKAVYGMPLYSFIRTQKMEAAAGMLRDTNMTILEVAGRHGYDNASKFAGAFKTVMGMTPKEYRNAPTEIENRFV